LACKSEALLLDEPFANVDRASAALLESVVTSLVAGGITVVISSHDELLGAKLGARVIRLEDGRIEGESPASEQGPTPSEEFLRLTGRENAVS
jgi:ABC-type sulfate/molybdate transport systems ATPase subunit